MPKDGPCSMKRSTEWSHQLLSYLTAGLLFAAVLLRSLLLYRSDPLLIPVAGLLSVWLMLFIAETVLANRWPDRFTWRLPLYLLLQAALALALLSLPDSTDIYAVLFCILSMQTMQRTRPRTGAIWIGLYSLLMALPLTAMYGDLNGIAFALIYTAANVLLAFYALATRRAQTARTQNQALARQIQEGNRQLENYSKRLEQLAVARERQRFARELHDSVTQTIFSMTLTTQSAALLLERDPARAGPQLDKLGHLGASALSELRVLIAELDADREQGTLSDRIRAHVTGRQLADNLAITVESDGSLALSLTEEQALFRIAQEAVNNIIKHAAATQACIRLNLVEPPWMEIQDNGCGFDIQMAKSEGRVGLSSMRERATEIGWEIKIISSPGAGTRVRVEKPSGTRGT